MLAKLISEHPSTAGRYNVSPLVGSSSFIGRKSDPLELAEFAVQNEALENFRGGRTNLIVATSVIEEGIDVQATNLVVRFDEPKNLKSYVQSRGRARKEDSKFKMGSSRARYERSLHERQAANRTAKAYRGTRE